MEDFLIRCLLKFCPCITSLVEAHESKHIRKTKSVTLKYIQDIWLLVMPYADGDSDPLALGKNRGTHPIHMNFDFHLWWEKYLLLLIRRQVMIDELLDFSLLPCHVIRMVQALGRLIMLFNCYVLGSC